MWINKLIEDINSATNEEITLDTLIQKFLAFRAQVSNSTLRSSYPDEDTIKRHWVKAKGDAPYIQCHDFILSFLHHSYPNIQTRLADNITNKLALHVAKEKPKTSMGRIIAKERYRRDLGPTNSYWQASAQYLDRKYTGYYLLIRMCGNETVVAEPFGVTLNKNLPNLLSMYWLNSGEKWIGDLYINPTKFVGILTRNSTDKIMEPVPLSLLRVERIKNPDNSSTKLILSGEMTGWVTNSDEQLVCSKVAAWKLPIDSKPQSIEDLQTLSKRDDVIQWINEIENGNKETRKTLQAYFGEKWFRTGKLSARNQLSQII